MMLLRSNFRFVCLLAAFALLTKSGVQSSSAEMVTREGMHLRLTSDVADQASLEDFVSAFDAAVPQWCAFWGVPVDRVKSWRIDGYLMRDQDTFRTSGVLPANVPKFQYGFASPAAVWVNHQSTDYYNRHLILHEGVHALAIELFGGGGPSWYMEGTAELLATHRDRRQSKDDANQRPSLLAQSDESFLINDMPRTRVESPMWGRFRVIDEARQANQLPTLSSVMKLPMNLAGDVESYTWCWAAALMMTHYPDTREKFIQAARNGADQTPAFTSKFFRKIQNQWPVIRARWQLWLHDLEYGVDPEKSRVGISVDDPRYDGRPFSLSVDSKLGWQSVGSWFSKNTNLQIGSDGSCVIVAKNSIKTKGESEIVVRDWQSEPTGISARFHRGFPIGQLQVCVLPIPTNLTQVVPPLNIQSWSGLAHDETITVSIRESSWLLFRIHDVPGESGQYQRSDNSGSYDVKIGSVKTPR